MHVAESHIHFGSPEGSTRPAHNTHTFKTHNTVWSLVDRVVCASSQRRILVDMLYRALHSILSWFCLGLSICLSHFLISVKTREHGLLFSTYCSSCRATFSEDVRLEMAEKIVLFRQHCAQRKALVYKLLRGRFWGFSPCRGDTLHWCGWNLVRRSGQKVYSSMPNFIPIGATIRV